MKLAYEDLFDATYWPQVIKASLCSPQTNTIYQRNWLAGFIPAEWLTAAIWNLHENGTKPRKQSIVESRQILLPGTISKTMVAYRVSREIKHILSASYHAQSNGLAEIRTDL